MLLDVKMSEYYTTLKKDKKRKYNKSYFTDYVQSNAFFFAKNYCERYNNIHNVLLGYNKKEVEEVIDECNILDV